MRLPALLFALLLALFSVGSTAAQPAPKVRIDLVAGSASVQPGGTVWVALRQRIDRGWHTYWRNPGDAGQATQIAWTLPPGWRAGEIRWPPPRLVMVGPLANYAYTDEVFLLVPITAPADARPGATATLRAAAAWLVCEEVCIPEDGAATLSLPVSAAAPPAADGDVARWLARVPRPVDGAAVISAGAGRVRLALAGPGLTGFDPAEARFFPYRADLIDHAAAQPVERGSQGLTLSLRRLSDGAAPAELAGVLTAGDRAVEVIARPGAIPAGAAGLGPVVRSGGDGALTLLPAVGLALLGGLLLNLMPCVFPILAMKAAHLLRHAGERRAARRDGLAYAAGVLLTFAALALAVIALQRGGEAVGWGFQLQSPPVVAALALLMLLIGLNLSGVYEIGARVQGVGGGLAGRSGGVGAFFTGVLAVVVAAPCTAPFMAGATGWALVQGPAQALAVFLALGVGLAAPFVLLSFAPRLLAWLPKPGAWMVGLQRLLAFPMYAAAAWLVWLVSRQSGSFGLSAVLAGALAAAFAAWLFGVVQRGGGWRARPLPAAVAALAVLLAAPAVLAVDAGPEPPAPALGSAALRGEAWSPARLAALQAQGRPVFVNYTADWCVTCKWNERATLSNPGVAAALSNADAAYLVADWTRRDPAIAAALAEHGRQGVPLYVVYGRNGEARLLPQILSADAVVEALERASAS